MQNSTKVIGNRHVIIGNYWCENNVIDNIGYIKSIAVVVTRDGVAVSDRSGGKTFISSQLQNALTSVHFNYDTGVSAISCVIVYLVY